MKNRVVMIYTAHDKRQAQSLDEVKEIALNLFDENKILQDQIKSLQNRLFGRKSEKTPKDDKQMSLFDMPEPDFPILEEPETVTIAGHTRKKRGRKPHTR